MSGAAGDERSRLVRALALSRRFHLYLARCESPRAADRLIEALGEELPRLRGGEIHLVRLDPYAGRATDAPLTDQELADSVLLPLLSPPDDLRAHGAIHVVDASRATHADTDAWARLFSLWNEKRNVMQAYGGEVLVLLPQSLAPVFATKAPDVWSIRSGEYTIHDETQVPLRGSATVRCSATATLRVVDMAWSFRAIPLLALFGGDLVVRPWVEDIVSVHEASDLLIEVRATKDDEPNVVVQRTRRLAETALAERRFGEAEAMFRELLGRIGDLVDGAHEIEALALSGLCVALAAQDRAGDAVEYGERALALVDTGAFWLGLRDRVRRANALVRWCVGHLQRTDELSADTYLSAKSEQSRALRLVERGHLDTARVLLHPKTFRTVLLRGHDSDELIYGIVIADLLFMAGELDGARRKLESVASPATSAWPKELLTLLPRRDALMALIELARGNTARAARLVPPHDAQGDQVRQDLEPEGVFRAGAMHAYASAILAAEAGDPDGARTSLHHAQHCISDWGREGLDRRSRLRASVAVDLGLTMLETSAEKALPMARELAGEAEALLGDTAEDCIARVLAVRAHAELGRRAAAAEDQRVAARRALDLARPLGGLGVPAWDALLQAAEEQAAAIETRK